MKNISAALLLLLFVLTAVLTFTNLGAAAFWDDEAQVGIFAHNLISTGRLTGWDGRNLYAYRDGSLIDKNLMDINPPLDVIAAAASFKLLGQSNRSGRAPFALAGLLALVVFARLLFLDFPEAALRLYALGALSLSSVFLLNIRNCRYYALSLLFSLLCVLYARISLQTGKKRHFFLLGLFAALSFYSSYYLGMGFLAALLITLLIFHYREVSKNIPGIVLSAVTFLVLTVPYALIHRIWVRNDITPMPWYNQPLLILWNFRELNVMGALPWVLAAGLAAVFYVYRPTVQAPALDNPGMPSASHDGTVGVVLKRTLEWITLAACYVILIGLFSPQDASITKFADLRYLFPIMPITAGLCGVVLWFVHRHNKAAAAVCFIVLIGTNILTLTPAALGSAFPETSRFQWMLPNYIKEITHPYPTADEAIASFFKNNAKQDDLVLCTPDYEDYPLLFYAGSKIKLCCTLDYKSPLPEKEIQKLNAPVYLDRNFPDWIVFFGPQGRALLMLNYFSRPHWRNGQLMHHFYRLDTILDMYYGQTQRPEIPWHSFGPMTSFDPRIDGVYIMKATPDTPVQQTVPSAH